MQVPYTSVEEAIALLGLLRPLPHEVGAMDPATRAAFEFRAAITDAALDDVLLQHREMMYREHLATPLSL